MLREYISRLPRELKVFYKYFMDSGHCLMCIPKQFVNDALSSDTPYSYVAPIPVKYVIEKGYKIINGYITIEVQYDKMLGVVVDEAYYEY